jgi:hypothetical protein
MLSRAVLGFGTPDSRRRCRAESRRKRVTAAAGSRRTPAPRTCLLSTRSHFLRALGSPRDIRCCRHACRAADASVHARAQLRIGQPSRRAAPTPPPSARSSDHALFPRRWQRPPPRTYMRRRPPAAARRGSARTTCSLYPLRSPASRCCGSHGRQRCPLRAMGTASEEATRVRSPMRFHSSDSPCKFRTRISRFQ